MNTEYTKLHLLTNRIFNRVLYVNYIGLAIVPSCALAVDPFLARRVVGVCWTWKRFTTTSWRAAPMAKLALGAPAKHPTNSNKYVKLCINQYLQYVLLVFKFVSSDLLVCVGFGAAMRFKTHQQKVDFVVFIFFDIFLEMCYKHDM